MMRIPLVDLKAQYNSIKPEIDAAIAAVIENSSFINGKPVADFEANLAAYCGLTLPRHAIGVSSGSSAISLALEAYGLASSGDEIITVPNTFIATAEAISHVGATPVFVDIDEKTMLMDTSKIESAITNKTRAIVPVHLYGQACDMDEIDRIAQKYNLIVVEDAAQAIAAGYKGKLLPFSETATLSFFPSKNLGSMGDGGAVLSRNSNVAANVAKLKDHGRIDKYNSDMIGYGERLDGLQAAILDAKLKHLDDWTNSRRSIASEYSRLLEGVGDLVLPHEANGNKHVYYTYVIRTAQRDALADYLKEKGIATGVHYPIPLHMQAAYNHLGYNEGDFPVAEKASREILSLPIYPELTDEQTHYVADSIKSFYNKNYK